MDPIAGYTQTLPWVDGVKGLQTVSSKNNPGPLAQTHCLAGTVFYKVLNLNDFQWEKRSPVGHGFHHDPWSLVHLAFHPFSLHVWLLKTFGFTPGRSSNLQMEIRGQPASHKDQTVNLLGFVGHMVPMKTTEPCCGGGNTAVDNTWWVSPAVFQDNFVCRREHWNLT